MIPEFGHYALVLALCIALIQGVLPLIGAHFGLLFIKLAFVAGLFLIYVRRKIGGVLGDVLGASEQIAESYILLYFVYIQFNVFHLPWLI